MIDSRLLRESPDQVRAAIGRRGGQDLPLLDQILELDRKRRDVLQRGEKLKSERNTASEEVARRKRAKEDASPVMSGLRELSEQIKRLDDEERDLQNQLEDLALRVPNLPLPELPSGDR